MHEVLTREAAEQIALELGGDVAFLRARQGVYFARRSAGLPFSPVLRLLRGVFELEPGRGRWIVRNPVYSTVARTATCAGAIKVAGHRLRAPVVGRDHHLSTDGIARIDAGAAVPSPRRASAALVEPLAALVAAGPRSRDESGLVDLADRIAQAVADRAPTESARADRPIAALLADAAGHVLEWATNTGAANVTGHAEMNLVELAVARWGMLPPGAIVVSSLKPCKMCAGVLWDTCGDHGALRVLFGTDDPGASARETVLEPGTMSRRVFSRPAEWTLAPQRQHPGGGVRVGTSRA